MVANDNYQLLIEKLDQFIRKYYINQLIRGSLYSIALLLALFLGLNFMEHYFYFPSDVRKVLFWSFVGISGFALGKWVLEPLFHYLHLGKLITHEQAARIIGQHFGNVKDKLLNILQLRHQVDTSENRDLILASIEQKSEEIKPVPFQAAIDLKQNRKYLKYALPPLLLLILILFVNSSLITDSTTRLLYNGREFGRPAPFHFELDNDALKVAQFEDFPLTVKVDGDALPNDVFIDVENVQYRLTKVDPTTFTYTFNKVQQDLDFRLFSGAVTSTPYKLEVLKKPNIVGFEVQLDYPAYVGKKDESLQNVGDLVIPQGTNIQWIFNAQNTDFLGIRFSGNEQLEESRRQGSDYFTFKKRVMKDEPYKLFVSNLQLPNADSIAYALSVVPDQYPSIQTELFKDSTDRRLQYFAGEANDDYGLSRLTFNYRVKKADGKEGTMQTKELRKPDAKSIRFDHTFDMYELDLQPGDEVTYYFEIWDNDGVNGNKSARTSLMVFKMPTAKEFEQLEQQNNEKIKEDLLKALKENQKIQEELQRLREKMLQEKELKWQDKKELEKLMDRQRELQQQIQQAKQSFEENLKNQEEFSKTEESIQQKQEQLQKLFEESMNEEMQQLMQQIEDLMEKLEKDGALEMMDQFQFNDQQMEMELDRLLELFKQLELEHEMQKAIDQLQELAEKQEELSKETEQDNAPTEQEELKKEQEEINEEFKELEEKLEELDKKNEELERPKELDKQEKEREEINKELNDSKNQLNQNQNKKAAKSQKKAADKMKEMANNLAQAMQSQEMEQMQEDMAALRQLLENLVTLSFDQENLMKNFGPTEINTPRYIDLTQQQFKLKDDFRLIEDSLHALSKRVYQIESFVTEKVTDIKADMKTAIDHLEERRKPQASENQQRVMKNVNDLALMLSETMEQMQQQMSNMMPGNQMCKNPGGQGKDGSVPKDKISEGQKSLNEQMQQMKKGLEKGMGGSSKEFAQMAAKQAAMREALRKKQQEMQQRGKGDPKLQEIIDQMNKVETDLVNKKLTNEMLKRQEEILTRLLEHEKAERERDWDNKRKSETAEQQQRKMPPSLEEYLKKREAEIENFKTISPALKPYFKNLVEEYHKSIKGGSPSAIPSPLGGK